MLTSEASHVDPGVQRAQRSRQRPSTSCTECRRRKQKCNQARDRPCNNCLRRYPPVECRYENSRKSPNSQETVITFDEPSKARNLNRFGSDHGPSADLNTPVTREESENYFRLDLRHSISPTERRHLSPEAQSVALESFWGKPSLSPLLERGHGHSSEKQVQLIHDPKSAASSQAFQITQQSRTSLDRRERCKEAYWGILDNYVGNTAIEPLRSLPIRASRRNAELFNLFTTTLSPYMSSLDGKDPPANFQANWIPFIVQSPLTAYIGILTAAYFIATANRIDVEKCADVIEARLTMVSVINGYLRTNRKTVSDEAIIAVISFSYNEWIYANETAVWAHMKGLREMLKLRGDLRTVPPKNLRDRLVSYDIFKADYQMACAFECPLFLHDDDPDDVIPILESYPLSLDTPLLQSSIRFVDSAEELGMSTQAATILDDMRFLTTSVLTLTNSNRQGLTKFHSTAEWIYQNLTSAPSTNSPPDFIHASVRAAAEIYTSALLQRLPLSKACTQPLLTELWMNMWRVPLSTWKRIPGIFLWIVFLVLPFARDKPEGRFIKAMTAVAIITVGLRDWETCVVTMRGFRAMQGWLGGVRGLEEGKRKGDVVNIDLNTGVVEGYGKKKLDVRTVEVAVDEA